MKTRGGIVKKALSLACCLAMALSMVPAAAAAGGPVKSGNKNAQDYSMWADTVKSYLYENGDGGLTRVEYAGGQVVVEDYDSGFNYLSGRTIEPELSVWGGFYAGEDYNFLIFGQTNPDQSDSREVIRVVKYGKDWERLGQASLKGANTTVPFDAGSLRCDEYGGYLFIRTCHEMYKSSDGYNHQSNLTMAVRQSDMAITDSYYDVMNNSYGYISHSFNQFILVDEDGKVVALDHGDAYPRGVAFSKYYADASTGKFSGGKYSAWCSYGNLMEFAGSVGANATGASVGGLAETADCYIMAYNYDGQGGRGDRYPYFHWMDKSTGRSWSAKLTQTPGSTTPVLAPTGLDGGYMLWNGKSGYTVDDTLYYLHYGSDGQPSELQTASGSLSDCQPIYYNGRVVWYVTDSSAPVFYLLDGDGVRTAGGGSAQPVEPADPCANGHTWKNSTLAATCLTEGQNLRTCTVCGAKEVLSAIPKAAHTWVQKTEPATATAQGRNYQVCSVCGTEETLSVIPVLPSAGRIMSNPNLTFSDIATIAADGAMTVWNKYRASEMGLGEAAKATAPGKFAAMDVYVVPGSNSYFLTDGGELWELKGGKDDSGYAKIADGVTQVSGGTVLKKDGTVWSLFALTQEQEDGINYDQPSRLFYVMSGAKQVGGTGITGVAVKTDGSLWSWGDNSLGNLGWRSDRISRNQPHKIMDNVAYACGSMAIKEDGSLWSWGSNYWGGVGSGGGYDCEDIDDLAGGEGDHAFYLTAGPYQLTPVKIMDNVVGAWSHDSDSGESTKYALTADGSLYSWGYGPGRVLGYEDAGKSRTLYDSFGGSYMFRYQETPRRVEVSDVVNLSYSGQGMLVQKSDGSLWSVGPCMLNDGYYETFTKVTDGVMLDGSPASIGAKPVVFSDVAAGDWFKAEVDKVAAAGIMNGIGDGLFAPYGRLTVSQALKLAYELDDRAAGGAYPLPQTGGAWYAPYYQYCLDRGIVTEDLVREGGFDREITRFDMVEILDKAIPASRMQAVRTVDRIPDLAENAAHGGVVYKWYRADILRGDEAGRFNGNNSITRAEVAAILCRISNL